MIKVLRTLKMKHETSPVGHPKLRDAFDNSDLNLCVSLFLSYKIRIIVALNFVGNHRLANIVKHLHAMLKAQHNHM